MNTAKPKVTGFYDEATGSIQYVVSDPATKACAIIDPVLDFDERSGAISTINADLLLDFLEEQSLTLEWILETHPHADHLSAAHYLTERTGAPTAIGERVAEVQAYWREIYNWPNLPVNGSQWDRLFTDGESFPIGGLETMVMFTPGHTPASITYLVGDCAFVHDTLFMPDSGTARCDFPGGSAGQLWNSIQRILALPESTRLFVGHDYRENSREPEWETTVAEQKATNAHISGCQSEAEFVTMREARDHMLAMPRLILYALQVNIDGGRLPAAEANGRRYLKIPLDAS